MTALSHLRPVLAVLARVLLGFSLAFVVPLAFAFNDGDDALERLWAMGGLATLGAGWVMWLATRRYRFELQPHDGFLLVTLIYLVLPAIAAAPLMLSVPDITASRAYFEAMSALTASGGTAIAGLQDLPVSVNVWRCFLQFVGGLGIVMLVIAVLPLLGLGGTQLYKAEMAGPMKEERLTPRVADTARGLWSIYLLLSTACMLAYRWAGMGWADAFMHACTTMSLGGLSPYDASLGHFDSARIEWTAVVFMALAGISFVRYFAVWSQRSWRPLLGNFEIRMYGLVLLCSTSLITLLLEVEGIKDNFPEALRMAAFHVVSIATTTGYVATDYSLWPPFAPIFLLFLACFTSCAGSTGGGIKLIRMVILVKQASRELVRIVHPRAVTPVTLGNEVVSAQIIGAVLAFMLFYGASLVGLTLLLLLSGLDVVTAFSAVIACVNNVGPGLGEVGPAGNFAGLNAFALGVCSFAMLLGRLELLTVLVLFSPALWKR